MKHWVGLLGALTSLLVGAPVRAQSSYTFTDIGAQLGNTSSEGRAVNDRRHVVGSYSAEGGAATRGFFWDGAPRDLGTLGGTITLPNHINLHDEVVGNARLASGETHAFLWDPIQGIRDLNDLNRDGLRDFPDWVFKGASAINHHHQVVGTGDYTEGGVTHERAFLLDLTQATITNLGVVSRESSFGISLNNAEIAGQPAPEIIVSERSVSAPTAWFLYRAGVPPLQLTFQGIGINDLGQVVGGGYYWDRIAAPLKLKSLGGASAGAGSLNNAAVPVLVGSSEIKGISAGTPVYRACRWFAGNPTPTDLNKITRGSKGFVLTTARQVTDAGYIVGNCNGNIQHAYLLTPNP